MFYIGFKHELVKAVLSGEKTITYRLGDYLPQINVGDKVCFVDTDTHVYVGVLKIIGKNIIRFSEIPLAEAGHEKYTTIKQKYKVFETYYQRALSDDDMFTRLEFTHITQVSHPQSCS
jgi:hypothetical protein